MLSHFTCLAGGKCTGFPRAAAVLGVWLGLLTSTPGSADAGIVVTRAEGSISVDIDPPTDPPTPNSREFTATVPGSDTVEFTEVFSGGSGRVAYDVRQPDSNVLRGDFEAAINTAGTAPDGVARFLLEFDSDLPLRYRLTAGVPDPPQAFGAELDDVIASATFDSLGNASGTIPFDPDTLMFGEFSREGTLPAGSHRFLIESVARAGKTGGGASAGAASFEVVAIPLPPAVWAGLTVMGAIGFGQALRGRRRRAARD